MFFFFQLSIVLFSAVLGIGFVIWFWNLFGRSSDEENQASTASRTIRDLIKCHKQRVEEEIMNAEKMAAE